MKAVGRGHYIAWEYVWQPRESDCRYNGIENAFLSSYPAKSVGFVVSAGYCEDDSNAPRNESERLDMMLTFKEVEQSSALPAADLPQGRKKRGPSPEGPQQFTLSSAVAGAVD